MLLDASVQSLRSELHSLPFIGQTGMGTSKSLGPLRSDSKVHSAMTMLYNMYVLRVTEDTRAAGSQEDGSILRQRGHA
jgi:hypothetical protein